MKKLNRYQMISVLITVAVIVSTLFIYSMFFPIKNDFSNLDKELTDYLNGEIQVQVIETKRIDEYTVALLTDKNDPKNIGLATLDRGLNTRWRPSEVRYMNNSPIGNYMIQTENGSAYIIIAGINCTEPVSSYKYELYSMIDPETYFVKTIENPNFIDIYNYGDYDFKGMGSGALRIYDYEDKDITEEITGNTYILCKFIYADVYTGMYYLFIAAIASFGLFFAYVLWKYED